MLFALGAAGLTALAVAAWDAAATSAAIQNGPRAVATVVSVHVTSVSGRGGTQYTSHYRVIFATRSGKRITTPVAASGDDPCSCTRTLIAYDPARPGRAELAGDPLHTYGEALAVSGVAGGVVLIEVLLAVGWRRLRRQLFGGCRPPIPTTEAPPTAGRSSSGTGSGDRRSRGIRLRRGLQPLGETGPPGSGPGGRRPGDHRLPRLAAERAGVPPGQRDLGQRRARRGTGHSRAVELGGLPALGPRKDAFEPLLEPTYLALGGGTPPPGQPSSVHEAWIGAGDTPGSRTVDIWALSSPVAAGRFADAYLASLCYTFAHHSAVPARTVAPPSPSPPGETCVVTGLPEHPAVAAAWCVLPIGRCVVRGEATPTSAAPAATVPEAAAIVARAVAGGAAAPAH